MTGREQGSGRANGAAAVALFTRVDQAIRAQAGELDRLDAAVGDGDTGRNLVRGLDAARTALEDAPPASPAAALETLAAALAGAPGAAPRFWAAGCRAAAATLTGQDQPGPRELAAAFETAVAAIHTAGGAVMGDKTMIDVLRPAADALRVAAEDGEELATALERATASARIGMIETIAMPGRTGKGQAGERVEGAIGHRDPGAVAAYLVVAALAGQA